MDFLRKFWPASFKPGTVKSLVITIVIYVVLDIVAGLILGLLGKLPLLGWLCSIVGYLIALYCTAGIVFVILYYVGVLKNK